MDELVDFCLTQIGIEGPDGIDKQVLYAQILANLPIDIALDNASLAAVVQDQALPASSSLIIEERRSASALFNPASVVDVDGDDVYGQTTRLGPTPVTIMMIDSPPKAIVQAKVMSEKAKGKRPLHMVDFDQEEEEDIRKARAPPAPASAPLLVSISSQQATSTFHPQSEMLNYIFEQILPELVVSTKTHFIADQDLITKVLLVDTPLFLENYNPNLTRVYGEIIKARELGINQGILARVLKMDPKTLFHHLKILVGHDMIVKLPREYGAGKQFKEFVSFGNTIASNLLVSKKYIGNLLDPAIKLQLVLKNESPSAGKGVKKGDEEDNDDTDQGKAASNGLQNLGVFAPLGRKEKIIELLKDAKNNTLTTNDVMKVLLIDYSIKALKKSFFALIARMVNEGVVEKFKVLNSSLGIAEKGTTMCIQLKKSFLEDVSQAPKEPEKDLDSVVLDDEDLQRPLLFRVDASLEKQIFDIFHASGKTGILTQTIEDILPIGQKVNDKLLQHLSYGNVKDPKNRTFTKIVEERVGRAKSFRFYSLKFLEDLKKSENLQRVEKSRPGPASKTIESAPAPASSEPLSVFDKRCNFIWQRLCADKVIDTTLDPFIKTLEDCGIANNDHDFVKFMKTYTMDRKSVKRVVAKLKEIDKCSVINVAYTGNTRQLLLHPTISATDPAVIRKMNEIKQAEISLNHRQTRVEVRDNVEVSTLFTDSRAGNLTDDKGKTDVQDEDGGLSRKAKDSSGTGDQLPAFGNEEDVDAIDSRFVTSVKYGLIVPKLQRAKAFHEFLFNQTTSDDLIFTTYDCFGDITLKFYAETIGFVKESTFLQEASSHPEYFSTVKIRDLKQEEAKESISYGDIRKNTSLLFELLVLARLVEPMILDDSKQILIADVKIGKKFILSSHYKILRDLKSFNFEVDPPVVLKTTVVKTSAQLQQYWSGFESRQAQNSFREMFTRPKAFSILFNPRSWAESKRLPNDVRKILLRYVDASGSTPLANVALCESLATKCLIDVENILKFYRKLEKKKLKNGRPKNGEKMSLKGMRSGKLMGQSDDEDLDSDQNDENADALWTGTTRKLDHPKSDPNASFGKRHRYYWTQEQDELFLIANFVISKFSNLISRVQLYDQLMPGEDICLEVIRRKLSQVSALEENAFLLESYNALWPAFQRFAAEEKLDISIQAVSTQFLSITQRFLAFALLNRAGGEYSPEKRKEVIQFKEGGRFSKDYFLTDATVPIEEGLESKITRLAKSSFLHSLSISYSFLSSAVETISIPHIVRDLVSGLIKILLFIPDESYNSKHAFAMLSQYKDKDVMPAIEKLKKTSTIVKSGRNHATSTRRVPERNFVLTERASATLNGILPTELFDDAQKCFESWESNPPKLNGNGHLSSGDMAFILEKFSFKNLFPSIEQEVYEKIVLTKDSFDQGIKLLLKLPARKAGTLASSGKRSAPSGGSSPRKKWGNDHLDVITDSAILLKDASISAGANLQMLTSLHAAIVNAEALGKSVKELLADADFHSHESLQNSLKILLANGLINRVGFSDIRFIGPQFMVDWVVFVSGTPADEPTPVVPYIWHNLDGGINVDILNKSMQTILGIIVERPGIAEGNLLKRVAAAMNFGEMKTIIEKLIEKRAIKCEANPALPIYKSVMDGIFASSKARREVEPVIMVDSYYPLPGWHQMDLKCFIV